METGRRFVLLAIHVDAEAPRVRYYLGDIQFELLLEALPALGPGNALQYLRDLFASEFRKASTADHALHAHCGRLTGAPVEIGPFTWTSKANSASSSVATYLPLDTGHGRLGRPDLLLTEAAAAMTPAA